MAVFCQQSRRFFLFFFIKACPSFKTIKNFFFLHKTLFLYHSLSPSATVVIRGTWGIIKQNSSSRKDRKKTVFLYISRLMNLSPRRTSLPSRLHFPFIYGGFFCTCKDFRRMFDHSFLACAFFFNLEVEISSCTLIPLFVPGLVHSGSVSWDVCGQTFPSKLQISSFPDRFTCFAWTAA